MLYKYSVFALVVLIGGLSYHFVSATPPVVLDTFAYSPTPLAATYATITPHAIIETSLELPELREDEINFARGSDTHTINKGDAIESSASDDVFTVPFYSQFADISAAEWRKVGCGIASLAMLIEFYKPNSVDVDTLLKEGIAADAFLANAGWIHTGLIGLSKKYGLTGTTNSLAHLSTEAAFNELKTILAEKPVIASVHYTFDPQNPIPHLVVVNGVRDGKVYYNDPSEAAGGGSISIAKFQSSWKKRYIEIHPVS